MVNCPLCGIKATIVSPEWSGGRYLIRCAGCGEYSTNKITIDDLDSLRAAGNPRIEELQYSIAVAKYPLYVTKSQRFGGIVFESGPPRQMTKRQKKHRRRNVAVPFSGSINLISKSDDDPDED